MKLDSMLYEYRATLFDLLHAASHPDGDVLRTKQPDVDKSETELTHYFRLHRFLLSKKTCSSFQKMVGHLRDAEGKTVTVWSAYRVADERREFTPDTLKNWREVREALFPQFDGLLQELDSELRKIFAVE